MADETLKELMEATQRRNDLQKRLEKRKQKLSIAVDITSSFIAPPLKKSNLSSASAPTLLNVTSSMSLSTAFIGTNSSKTMTSESPGSTQQAETSAATQSSLKTELDKDTSKTSVSTTLTSPPSAVHMSIAQIEKEVLSILEALVLADDHRMSVASLLKDVQSRATDGEVVIESDLQSILHKLAFLKIISTMENSENTEITMITDVDHDKLSAYFYRLADPLMNHSKHADLLDDDIENLLEAQTAQEREKKAFTEEIMNLLDQPTAKDMAKIELFRSQKGNQAVRRFCPFQTRAECKRRNANTNTCNFLHFYKIIQPHTDESLGDCSFLNTCFHMDTCKYVHYDVEKYEPDTSEYSNKANDTLASLPGVHRELKPTKLFPPQWISCDLRSFDFKILGKFSVIMADPPWDIHMELPYGTMSDDEMRKLEIPCLQDEGYIFLWVTGRAMELGRQCLRLWGYKRVDEIIWVKTNQLQRLIRTGRTGHWLNHGKEHCLVGVKGNPQGVNKGIDCDVIVSEVRETSHKPDEIYGIIERLSPGTRKLELFGRPHNVQPNWITLGNQLDGTQLVDPEVAERFKKVYPNGMVAL